MQFINSILSHTNAEIIRRRDGTVLNDRSIRTLEQWEFLRWLGIRLTLSLERPRGSLETIFSNKERVGTVLRGSCYADRFKMSYTRFRQINSCLQIAEALPPGRHRVSNDNF